MKKIIIDGGPRKTMNTASMLKKLLAEFSEEAKRRYRDQHWEEDLQKAFEAGKRMPSDRSFIVVMTIGREHIHLHNSLFYFVDQSVLLGYSPGPLPRSVTGERFWLARSCLGMFLQFHQHF